MHKHLIIKLKSGPNLSIRTINSWPSRIPLNSIRRNFINNSVDDISSNKLLKLTEQVNRAKEATGKPDKDVDEIQTQSRGVKHRPTYEVVLTKLARRLQEIEQEMQKVPVVDRIKVDSVKERITSNNFRINPEKIAEQLLATDSLLC
ncbi:MAG: flagellar biosynthesis anti-sigma factor FlgM [Gammaproteobacteria bacterium]|nr:flagellar biosynthesis anti-sigma factor FlgM [Gammaproteobacteria bacterium]